MAVARRPDAKRQVLSRVATVPTVDMLKFVERYLKDEELHAAAEAAYEKIIDQLKERGGKVPTGRRPFGAAERERRENNGRV